MAQIKPFEIPWTPVHNYVFDEIMPKLSPNAWKVLCVAMRQTLGWAGNGPGGRREWDTISYSQFMKKAGIGGRATVMRALKDCLKAGYLVRRRVGKHQGTDKPIYAYALNTDYSIEVASSKTEPVPSSKTELTKERHRNKHGDGVSKQLAEKLIALGVHQSQAQKWATARPVETVLAWIEYVQRNGHGLSNMPGFLVAKLRDGEEPPTMEMPEDDRKRYIEGPYSHLIEH